MIWRMYYLDINREYQLVPGVRIEAKDYSTANDITQSMYQEANLPTNWLTILVKPETE